MTNHQSSLSSRIIQPKAFVHKPLLILLLLTVQLPIPIVQSSSISRPNPKKTSSSSSATSSSSPEREAENLHQTIISSSPLSIAAVCRDGVALLALHTSPSISQEPLLLDQRQRRRRSNTEDDDDDDDDDDNDKSPLADLPLNSRGPLRITPFDSYGSAILTNGWRTDGTSLTETCRILASREIRSYGPIAAPSLSRGRKSGGSGGFSVISGGTYDRGEYGRPIAIGLNGYMADCVVSDSVRSLCSVGLLATVVDCEGVGGGVGGGNLWLVDETGVYPCRAHAIGSGSDVINRKLMEWGVMGQGRKGFEEMGVEECARVLLDMVVEEMEKGSDGKKEEGLTLPEGTRVEIVVLEKRKLRRVRQRVGWGLGVENNNNEEDEGRPLEAKSEK